MSTNLKRPAEILKDSNEGLIFEQTYCKDTLKHRERIKQWIS